MRRRHFGSLLLSLALPGCATVGPPFSPHANLRAGQGVVYVYRPQARALSVLSAIIEVDGRPVATLENNTYAAIQLAAGSHTITQRWKAGILGNSKLENRPIALRVIPSEGREGYVRLGVVGSWHASGLVVHNEWEWELRELAASDAMSELRACTRSEVAAAQAGG
jgi:hypothetical protein